MTGTLVNAGAVIAGSAIGLLLNRRIPERFRKAAFDGIGLFTLALGFTMAARTGNFLILILAVVVGSLAGTALRLEHRMESISDSVRRRFHSPAGSFTEGFVVAFLLFCMGSMTVLGTLEEGLGGNPELLYSKSVLDGVASVALASTMGIGVMLSVVPLLLYQGGLTLAAQLLGESIPELAVVEMSAAGGVVLLGLGLRLLEIRKIRVLDMLPSLVAAALLAALW